MVSINKKERVDKSSFASHSSPKLSLVCMNSSTSSQNPESSQASAPNRVVKILVNVVSLLLIAFGVWLLVDRFVIQPRNNSTVPAPVVQEIPEPPRAEEVALRSLQIDQAGIELTRRLRQNGFDMGFIWSGFIQDLGFNLPVDVTPQYRETTSEEEYAQLDLPVPLEELIPAPENPELRNRLVFDDYEEVDAPIIYASFEDIFLADEEGQLRFDEYVNNDPVDSPVQVKLREGVVHLPFTPSPGEQGNAYIIGHSSNYSSVQSDFNYIFAPLINEVNVGEDFVIYDNLGRELTFEVIDTRVVREEDVATAYVKYEDKRTVTLQGSILEQTPEGILPTKRYLVIGELVVPEQPAPVPEEVLDLTLPEAETSDFPEEALQ